MHRLLPTTTFFVVSTTVTLLALSAINIAPITVVQAAKIHRYNTKYNTNGFGNDKPDCNRILQNGSIVDDACPGTEICLRIPSNPSRGVCCGEHLQQCNPTGGSLWPICCDNTTHKCIPSGVNDEGVSCVPKLTAPPATTTLPPTTAAPYHLVDLELNANPNLAIAFEKPGFQVEISTNPMNIPAIGGGTKDAPNIYFSLPNNGGLVCKYSVDKKTEAWKAVYTLSSGTVVPIFAKSPVSFYHDTEFERNVLWITGMKLSSATDTAVYPFQIVDLEGKSGSAQYKVTPTIAVRSLAPPLPFMGTGTPFPIRKDYIYFGFMAWHAGDCSYLYECPSTLKAQNRVAPVVDADYVYVVDTKTTIYRIANKLTTTPQRSCDITPLPVHDADTEPFSHQMPAPVMSKQFNLLIVAYSSKIKNTLGQEEWSLRVRFYNMTDFSLLVTAGINSKTLTAWCRHASAQCIVSTLAIVKPPSCATEYLIVSVQGKGVVAIDLSTNYTEIWSMDLRKIESIPTGYDLFPTSPLIHGKERAFVGELSEYDIKTGDLTHNYKFGREIGGHATAMTGGKVLIEEKDSTDSTKTIHRMYGFFAELNRDLCAEGKSAVCDMHFRSVDLPEV